MATSNRGQNNDQQNHYTEKQTLNNTNPIKNRGWTPKGVGSSCSTSKG